MSNLDYDIKHGITKEEVIEYLDKIRNSPEKEFVNLRDIKCAIERLEEIEKKLSIATTIIDNKNNQLQQQK